MEDQSFLEPILIKDVTQSRVVPPESFFAFEEVKNNSRNRLLKGNQDIFLIWGQNGIISVFIILSYLSV